MGTTTGQHIATGVANPGRGARCELAPKKEDWGCRTGQKLYSLAQLDLIILVVSPSHFKLNNLITSAFV